jgi:hypothetical protein
MTAVYSCTRDQVINAALRTLGVIGAGDKPSPNDYQNCAEALNLYVKQLQTKGLPLWMERDLPVPMVTGQYVYALGPTGDVICDRPLRIVMAFIRNPQGNDTVLQMISRQEYMQLGEKTTQGIPNQFYYDPQLDNGLLYLYDVPSASGYTVHCQVQMPISDILTPNAVPQFPSEWFNTLKFGLADQVALEYGAPSQVRAELAMRADKYLEEMTDWSQEEASTSFQPNMRFNSGGW